MDCRVGRARLGCFHEGRTDPSPTGERDEIHRSGARCFCPANGNPKAAAMAERYLANLARIAGACDEPGPFLYAVHASSIERLSIGSV